MKLKRTAVILAAALAVAGALLAAATRRAIRNFPDGPVFMTDAATKPRVLARDGTALSYTLENQWNVSQRVPLASVPQLLMRAVVISEDQHFYEHHGVDWRARLAALWQNLRARAEVRGASTITEQVVRMIHPRPRTVWSRWVEGFEAARIERQWSKAQLLEFYLNQVPYAQRRRGVVQAARLYFDRDLDTLSPAETLSLAVLVRSPSGMDLRRNRPRAQRAIDQLADRLERLGDLSAEQCMQVHSDELAVTEPAATIDAGQFVRFVLNTAAGSGERPPEQIRTTLDAHFQVVGQEIVDAALHALAKRKVQDAAMLVIDNQRDEIQAWVVADREPGTLPVGYDTVLTPRQPGSTMKPLLYALAIERGWTAATLIDDSDLQEAVGAGQHTFHNYSRLHYGPLRLREALGNSLNIPAVKTLKFVGQDAFLERLHAVGITSLKQHPDFYGDGLALGNGEVSLYEMAQAYTVLARGGRYLPLTFEEPGVMKRREATVYSAEAATLVGNILADPSARMLEFGRGLQFPVETAIKTGTSTDYRDAWAIAFDYGHTVAVWLGNLDGKPMDGVTGAVGPAMIVRSMFSELNRNQETHNLPLSTKLISAKVCLRSGAGAGANGTCESTDEWFLPGTVPAIGEASARASASDETFRLAQPTPGLHIAHDPRIPAQFEALTLRIDAIHDLQRVDWYIDGLKAASTSADSYVWSIATGTHDVYARVWQAGSSNAHPTPTVRFYVH